MASEKSEMKEIVVALKTSECPTNNEKDDEDDEKQAPTVVVLFLAETLGTAMLMLFGCMGCVVEMVKLPVVPHLPGISFGLSVLIVIQTIGHISGAHLNPQVSIAAFILGKLKLALVPVYILAQFLGACLGFGLLKLVTPDAYSSEMCNTAPDDRLNPIQAVVVEIAITCGLILVCGGVWDPRNSTNTDSTPVRFGLVVACLSMVAGPYTCASMNTARSFAPALLNNTWNSHWVYWIGPTTGAVIGSVFYKYVLAIPRKKF